MAYAQKSTSMLSEVWCPGMNTCKKSSWGVALRYAVTALTHPTHRTHFISLSSFKGTLLTGYKSDYTLHLTYFSPLKEKPLKSGDTEPCQGILTSINQLQMKGARLGSHLQQCPSALLWILLMVAIPLLIITSLSFQAEALQGCPWDAACEWQEPWMSSLLSFVDGGYLAHIFEDCCVSWEAKRGQSWRVTALAPACFSADCSLLSAVIPFQWQCAGCQFLRSLAVGVQKTPQGRWSKSRDQGGRIGLGNCIQGVLPMVFWCCQVTCEKFSKQGETSVSPFCKAGCLTDRAIFTLGAGETRGAAAGQC